MSPPPPHPRDPFAWNLVIAVGFCVACFVRIAIPGELYFDEVHYLPAVRTLGDLSTALNIEHPPLGKQIIGFGVWLLGDRPLGWRFMSVMFGTLAVFAGMRAMWFARQSRAASLLAGLFLATGFLLFVHSRIAMLDIFMAGFLLLALWMCAGALRENETARWRLAIAGIALGGAMAAKWNAVPLAIVPGLAFLAVRVRAARWDFLTARRGSPIGGMTLVEAGLWLGVVPLAVYALSYWPFAFYDHVPGNPQGLIALHRQMFDLQTQVLQPHPYESVWYEWVTNWRAIWYLYEEADGAQRGVLLIGNPLSSLAALPALVWCAWIAAKQRRMDAAAVVVLYVVSLAMWIVAPKAVQFYYHYLLPHSFSMAALALATERLWQRGERLVPLFIGVGSLGLFAYFFPILTAAPLDGPASFLNWAWLESWR